MSNIIRLNNALSGTFSDKIYFRKIIRTLGEILGLNCQINDENTAVRITNAPSAHWTAIESMICTWADAIHACLVGKIVSHSL
jgi:hypothetical protein